MSNLCAYVATRAIPGRFHVLPVIERHGWDAVFVVDDERQATRLKGLGVHPGSTVIMPFGVLDPGEEGVTRKRDWIVRNVMPCGVWSLWIDDNIRDITGISPYLSVGKVDFDHPPAPLHTTTGVFRSPPTWRQAFAHSLTRRELERHFDETIDHAERRGTVMAGFSTENNYYFRARKWQYYGYCRTQMCLYKNDGSSWVPFEGRFTCFIEDMAKSIDVVCRYGCIVLNRHVKQEKVAFEAGGLGAFTHRLPSLQDSVKRLCAKYPGLIKPAGDGKTYGLPSQKDFHITFARRGRDTVDRWRKENGYL